MSKIERTIWVILVSLLLGLLVFGIFIKDAWASNKKKDENIIDKISRDELNNKLGKVLYYLENYYVDIDKLDEKKLINGAVSGLINAIGDPHTEYLSKEYLDELKTLTSGSYGGVGMIISEKDGKIIVVSPIEDSPAYRKGIKAGDYILSVDDFVFKDISVEEAANKLRGKPGTKVKVEFLREDLNFDVELTRETIDLPTVKFSEINNKYGYLRITQFAGTTAEHVQQALEDFKKKNVQGIIVDLRYNGGGSLAEVIEIVDFFQSEGIIVSTKGRIESEDRVEKATKSKDDVNEKIPVIVLIDNGSASASEIFAGAIKDNKRGILLGEKSYGKGSVQTMFQLDKEDGIKITIAKYYTPSGICIDGIGINPDIEVKEPELNDNEKYSLKKLYDDKAIDKLLKENPKPSNEILNQLVEKLIAQGYNLPKRYLKKLLKNAAEISTENKEIYDLEFDLQLQKALEIMDNGKLKYENKKFILKQ